MNERIRQLVEQAGAVFTDVHAVSLLDDEIEKFAELIVRECAKLLPPEMTHGPDGRPLEQVFKQHFGVEQ
jgi:hypothetical protein